MRRKLIKQDAFDSILKESVSTAQRELVEAQHVLSKALGKGLLSLHCFTESTVVYETPEKSYIHAGYEIKNGQVTLNNIEELVIDESSRKGKVREIISEMIDAVVSDDRNKADMKFRDYLSLVRWDESKKHAFEGKKKGFPFGKKDKHHGKDKPHFGGHKDMEEAYTIASNVLDYAEFVKYGPALQEAISKTDERGNVTDLRIPTNEVRTQNKIKSFDWTVTNHENFNVRNKEVPALVKEQEFCKAVANLKRQNAFSDHQALEEALDAIVQKWPQLLLVTQAELSHLVGESLAAVGATNFDDQTCDFMAEGILRKAHSVWTEKVNQILHLASAPKMEEKEDAYVHFQKVVERYYPAMDEKFGLERKAFSDIYEVLEDIYKKADRRGDERLKKEAASHLNGIADVLNGEIRPDIVIVEDAAKWVTEIIETNLSGGKWDVSNKPHMTVNGDHPDMAKKASHGYAPSKDFSGDWGDPAPMISQDNMSYKGKAPKQARKDSWGNEGGKEVFPSLKNPYIPKPFGDYTMKGEKGVDKDATGQHWSTWSSADTWPNLDNPYVPKEAGGVGGKGYKPTIDSKDLVVNK